jgi:mono/diheme cytochrome c family protein
MERASRRQIHHLAATVAVIVCTLGLSACSARQKDPDLIAGKQMFVQKCGSCHTLSRAGTKGTQGPNLDEAFQQSEKEGFGESAIRGVVAKQIAHPSVGPRACEPDCVAMPADLASGDDVNDIASYVALVAGRPGKDEGLLASAVKAPGSGKPAVEKNGVIQIPADPTGQLAYLTKLGTGTSGSITIESPNKASIVHDIVIDGKGAGKQVSGGKVSKFNANFTPGKYTYYCSVPGHRQAGMQGVITIK